MSASRSRPQRAATTDDNNGERLQKLIAHAGLGSRREVEQWIEQGRVSVDGKVAKLGDRALGHQTIRVDGRILKASERPAKLRVLLYHKPEGELCTRSDPQGRPTVFAHLPLLRQGRWISVGRLDLNTSGLLLFTNDGELANCLMHPRLAIEREYAVRVFGDVSLAQLQQLQQGVVLEDGPAQFDSISDVGGEGKNHWYHVTLHEGRNREVRRLWEVVGAKVSRLTRVRFGDIVLPRGLRAGRWQELEGTVLHALLQLTGLRRPGVSASTANPRRNSHPARRRRTPRTSRH